MTRVIANQRMDSPSKMGWTREDSLIRYNEVYRVDKDIMDVVPNDMPWLKVYHPLKVVFHQIEDMHCRVETEYDGHSWKNASFLKIDYMPPQEDNETAEIMFLAFLKDSEEWHHFLSQHKTKAVDIDCRNYSGTESQLFNKLVPFFENGILYYRNWAGIKDFLKMIFANIQDIQLTTKSQTPLSRLLYKLKTKSYDKQDIIECYTHFKTYLHDYLLESVHPRSKLNSYASLNALIKFERALEKTGLPMRFVDPLFEQVVIGQSCTLEMPIYDMPYYDKIEIRGVIGIETIDIQCLSMPDGDVQISLERAHNLPEE